MPRIQIAGVGFDRLDSAAVLARIERQLTTARPSRQCLIVTPNPEMVLAAQADPEFKAVLRSAALAVPDGSGILWAAYFLHSTSRSLLALLGSLLALICCPTLVRRVLTERVTGTDLLPEILRLAAQHSQKVFLLGAAPGVAELVGQRSAVYLPDIRIAGTHAGSPAVSAEREICSLIRRSGAQVLCVAYGAPAQELWLARNLPKLPKVKLAIGVGGAFDFHAGLVRRAPVLLRRLGLEWLWRLLLQPSRWRRIWNATFRFIALVWRVSRGARR